MRLYIPENLDIDQIVYDYPQEKHELVPQEIPLNITYEDDSILIVNGNNGKNASSCSFV